MVHLKALEKAGYSDDKLKGLFTSEKPSEKVKDLIELNSQRIDDEVLNNLREASTYEAIDSAYDVSKMAVFNAVVTDLITKGRTANEVLTVLNSVPETRRLSEMMVPATHADGSPVLDDNQKPIMRLDIPVFVNVFLPLVASYVTIRWARLWNERDRYPLFKYEPLRTTRLNTARCEILTARIERMSTDMGYRDDLRAAIQQVLKYGRCLMMPAEPYYAEYQQKADGKEYCVREGLRFEMPHPSRSFMDRAHRYTTANSNTGTEYCGFWTIRRWKDVKRDENLWNKERINFGYSDDMVALWNRWRIFEPCAIKFPTCTTGPKDRLDAAFRYNDANLDDGITLVSFFHKLTPKEWGLYDYDYPVWHRFVFAGPGTVVHCCPLSYNPLITFLYDYDIHSDNIRSLALELLPFQDQLSNLLMQYLAAVRNNLDRIVFYNSDMVLESHIKNLGIAGERRVKGTIYIPYSKSEMEWGKQERNDVFFPFAPPLMNTAEVGNAIQMLLAALERSIGISPQEYGGAASHEQSAQEVRVNDVSRSHRQRLTSSGITSGERAWKLAIYEALVQAKDVEEDFEVVIDDHEEELRKAAKELKFEVREVEGTTLIEISGDRQKLELDAFASEREGEDRIQDARIAAAIVQAFQIMFSNPVVVQQLGAEQMLEMFNGLLRYVGVPEDFRLRARKGQPGPEGEQATADKAKEDLAAIAQLVDQKIKDLAEQVLKPMQESNRTSDQKLAEMMAQLGQKVMQIGQITAAGAQKDQQQDQALIQLVQMMKQFAAMTNAVPQPPPPFPGGQSGPPVPFPGPGLPSPPQVPQFAGGAQAG